MVSRLAKTHVRWGWFSLPGYRGAGFSFGLERWERALMLFRDDHDDRAATATLEGRADLAMQCSDLGIWDWDLPTGSIVVDLPNADLVLASRAAKIARVSDIEALMHPGDVERVRDAIVNHIKGRTSFYEAEYRYRLGDEAWRWGYDRGRVAQRDTFGRAVRMVGTHRDITDRKLIEEQLRQAQKLESIGALAAGIAHEINTPAQYVGDNTRFLRDAFQDLVRYIGTLQALLERGTPVDRDALEAARSDADLDFVLEEIPRAIGQSEDGVQRISSIVRAMKEFSHPGLDEQEPVDVNRAIESTVTVARNEWKYVADLELDLEPALPPVPGHPGEINQAILNLVINGAHAIAESSAEREAGKGSIVISTRQEERSVVIRITDNGPGIPDEIRERIFDPFFTTKEVGRGTGQGLAIVRSVIVDKHGGEITFESRPDEGTTFTIRLPRACEGESGA